MDQLAAAGRDGSVAVWRVSEAEGGLRSEALLALQLRDAAGARAGESVDGLAQSWTVAPPHAQPWAWCFVRLREKPFA